MTARLFVQPASAEPGVPSLKAPAAARRRGGLLGDAAAAAGIVVWEAWEPELELVSFRRGASCAWPLSPSQTATGARWRDNIYPPDLPQLERFLQPGDAAPSRSVDYRLIVGDGELMWARHWVLRRGAPRRGRRRLVSAIMPIPEQKFLEWQCLRATERISSQIGQELHDDLCQVLAGTSFMMSVLEQRARKADPGLADEIADLTRQIGGTTDRVRAMAHGLFPARLNFGTLADALNAAAAQLRTSFSIDVDLQLPAALPRHTPEQILNLYRILQESIHNAVRHGRATSVRITLGAEDGAMRMRIVDNGRGFPTAQSRPEGIGTHVMQYRAHALGGSLTVEPASPRGVIVQLSYPMCHPKPGNVPERTIPP